MNKTEARVCTEDCKATKRFSYYILWHKNLPFAEESSSPSTFIYVGC